MTAIQKSKNVELNKFIYSLAIPNIGKKSAKLLANEFGTFENFKNSTAEQLNNIFAFGDVMSESIVEYFKNDVWMQAFKTLSLDMDFYNNRERQKDEILPWDFIDAGVTKAFLWREYENGRAEKVTPNCRKGCAGCGAKVFGGGVCFEERTETGESVVTK